MHALSASYSTHAQSLFHIFVCFFLYSPCHSYIIFNICVFFLLATIHSVCIISFLPPSLPFLPPVVGCVQAAQALQLQQADSCDALLAAAGREEEDGTAMELTQLFDQIRAQCNQSRPAGLAERHRVLGTASDPADGLVGPSQSGSGAAAASRTHRGAVTEVGIHFHILTHFFYSLSMVFWL